MSLYIYGTPVEIDKIPNPRKKHPEYDFCLDEFLISSCNGWKLNRISFQSHDVRVILSSIKWRIRRNPKYKGIQAFMDYGEIYLVRKL